MFEENEILTQIKQLGADLNSRLDEMDARLSRIERGLAVPQEPARLAPPTPLAPAAGHLDRDPAAPLRTFGVTVRPLHEVSRVRVVENAFEAIEGVESAALQTLSGDAARLDVTVRGDVGLIAGLRRTLGLAFDVSDSDDSSFTIALAQPGAEREGGVAARHFP
jgi:hypothetical protein